MNGELKHRIRVQDDLATAGWKLLWRISPVLAGLIVISGLLNLGKPDIGFQVLAGLGGLLALNTFFYGLHRLFRRWRLSLEREWPER